MGHVYAAKAAAAAVVPDPTHPDTDPVWPPAWGFPPANGPNGPWPPGWPPALPAADRIITMAESSKDIDYDGGDTGATWTASTLAGTGSPKFMIGSGNILYAFRHNGTPDLICDLSVDGGKTWEERGTVCTLNGMGTYAKPILSGTKLLILAQASNGQPTVYNSENGGKTWTGISIFETSGFVYPSGLLKLANGDILAFVSKLGAPVAFKVHKSTDDGDTFGSSIVTETVHTSNNVVLATNGNIVSVGKGIWLSTDSALNWSDVTPSAATYYSVAISGNNILTIKNTGEMYYSQDGGATWTAGDDLSAPVGTADGFQMLHAYSGGYVATPDTGTVYHSAGLTTFTQVSGNPASTPHGVFVLDV